VVDCAHGATYHVAPAVFEELGAEVVALGVSPTASTSIAMPAPPAAGAAGDAVLEHRRRHRHRARRRRRPPDLVDHTGEASTATNCCTSSRAEQQRGRAVRGTWSAR
jgi:hypothetical protein